MYVRVCAHMRVWAHMWRSGDNLQGLVLSLYHAGAG